MAELEAAKRRTKRRYAHELYPHADEYEIRPLAVEVPYLYARAVGMHVIGTGWFDSADSTRAERQARTMLMINANQIALLADALSRDLVGDEAWAWVAEHSDETGEWVYHFAIEHGVAVDQIKPYPCGLTPDHHDHLAEPDKHGWRIVTRAPGAEDACEECTEAID